ncbi:WD domain G-beta repeat [Carpediemonas membranifera]|uniref:WD domain G-beta repeat n=1 Tax=Carpediemonas membranifera TaxID=201153 RepID=A0A8J6B6Y4_9EUKA|nr:WD domain G-beta repeat [Carpediemonas membranifera]|eukprot:KAG9396948.1 WD domain G-beta repeat [Carpediemonas membranifera]
MRQLNIPGATTQQTTAVLVSPRLSRDSSQVSMKTNGMTLKEEQAAIAEMERLTLEAKAASREIRKLEKEFTSIVNTLSPMRKIRLATRSRLRADNDAMSSLNPTPQRSPRSIGKSSSSPTITPRAALTLPPIDELSAQFSKSRSRIPSSPGSRQHARRRSDIPTLPLFRLGGVGEIDEKTTTSISNLMATPRTGQHRDETLSECADEIRNAAGDRARFMRSHRVEVKHVRTMKRTIVLKHALSVELKAVVSPTPYVVTCGSGSNFLVDAASSIEAFRSAKVLEITTAQITATQRTKERMEALESAHCSAYPHVKGRRRTGIVGYTNTLARQVRKLEAEKEAALRESMDAAKAHRQAIGSLSYIGGQRDDPPNLTVKPLQGRDFQVTSLSPSGPRLDTRESLRRMATSKGDLTLDSTVRMIQRHWRAWVERKRRARYAIAGGMLVGIWRDRRGVGGGKNRTLETLFTFIPSHLFLLWARGCPTHYGSTPVQYSSAASCSSWSRGASSLRRLRKPLSARGSSTRG